MSQDSSLIRSAESVSVILAVGNNPAGRVLSWRFVKQNWDSLVDR